MEKIFNELIDSFVNDRVGIAKNFINPTLSNHLILNLHQLNANHQLISAGTGNGSSATLDKNFRSDKIHWLDRSHDNIHENSFLDLMDSFILYLNNTCYTGITGYEFHYTLYEEGTFYKKHLDQFRNDDTRQYSMIMYLNQNWTEEDGGELCIYHADHRQNISPTSGKSVFFRSSELPHEVLLTNKPRMSITGWLKIC